MSTAHIAIDRAELLQDGIGYVAYFTASPDGFRGKGSDPMAALEDLQFWVSGHQEELRDREERFSPAPGSGPWGTS